MKTEYITPAMWGRLMMMLQPANARALRLALETGLRIDDVLSLTPDELKGQKLKYKAKKTGKAGTKTISKVMADELRLGADKHFLFPGRYEGSHRTRQTVWADIKRASKKYGVKANVAPHSARKIFAVDYYHKHGLEATQKELQHDRSSTTMIYAFSDICRAAAAAEPGGSPDLEALADLIAARVVDKLKGSS